MEIQQPAQGNAHSRTSLNSEEEGGGGWKSGVLIVAMNAGNAACANLRRYALEKVERKKSAR